MIGSQVGFHWTWGAPLTHKVYGILEKFISSGSMKHVLWQNHFNVPFALSLYQNSMQFLLLLQCKHFYLYLTSLSCLWRWWQPHIHYVCNVCNLKSSNRLETYRLCFMNRQLEFQIIRAHCTELTCRFGNTTGGCSRLKHKEPIRTLHPAKICHCLRTQ